MCFNNTPPIFVGCQPSLSPCCFTPFPHKQKGEGKREARRVCGDVWLVRFGLLVWDHNGGSASKLNNKHTQTHKHTNTQTHKHTHDTNTTTTKSKKTRTGKTKKRRSLLFLEMHETVVNSNVPLESSRDGCKSMGVNLLIGVKQGRFQPQLLFCV